MTDENSRESLQQDAPLGEPTGEKEPREERAEPEEIVSWYAPPEADEPEEIVSWYMPPEDIEEIVDYYIHPEPLPAAARKAEPAPPVNVWKEAARREKQRRRRNVWIFVACMAVIFGIIAAAIWQPWHKREEQREEPDGDEDSASSIVDIFRDKHTAIPRYQGDASVRLTMSAAAGDVLTAPEVYAKVNPAVVTVVAEEGNGTGSVGTGVIMTPDGYVVTNAHVISGGKTCWIMLSTGYTYDAELVGYDEEEDLAVLHAVDAEGLPTAEFGNSDRLVVGETVYAIGNPLGMELRGTFTEGIISAVNRDIEVESGYMTMLQTTAALNSGNSGGPLINSSGQVVGINTMKMSNTSWEEEATVEGLGFAIPISSASFVVNDLIAYGEFRGVPTIGITVITANREDGNGTQVVVYSVEEGYGAAEAGVQEGDVIVAADGQPVETTADLLAVRRTHGVGESIALTLLRDGRTVQADVMLYSSKGK